MTTRYITISSEFSEIHKIGSCVRETCNNLVSLDTVALLEIAVVEASNNVVEHAYKEAVGHEIKFEVSVKPNSIIFTIKDNGIAMPPKILEKSNGSFGFDPDDIDNLPEGGFGLEILKQVMDDISYASDNGTNCLRLTHIFNQSDDEKVSK